jgi:ferredoxin
MPDDMAGDVPTIVVDRELCMGSGMCIVYAPLTFAHDDETKAIVVDPDGDPIESIRNAVQACPTSAIRLVDEDENESEGA